MPWRSSRLLCWVFSTCASSSPLEADVLCVARVTRLAGPTCRASALPLEERRHVFRVVHKLPRETKGEKAEQGPKDAAEGAAAGAENSAGGNGGPAGEQVRVVVPLLFARHTHMVVLCLYNPPRSSGGSHFRKYNAFILLLGMVRPMAVDGIWERDGLLYNPFMAQFLSRKEYYVLRRTIRPDVVELPEECNGQWPGAWRFGGAACGDESVVPHKGIRAGPILMFIARKPHSTGIKLYCLADALVGTWWTSTCTRADAGTSSGLATVQATSMPNGS